MVSVRIVTEDGIKSLFIILIPEGNGTSRLSLTRPD